MKWLDTLTSRTNAENETSTHSHPPIKWIVSDIEGDFLSLMQGDVESEDYLENIRVLDPDLLGKIRHYFNEEESVLVEVDESRTLVISAFKQDLSPIT